MRLFERDAAMTALRDNLAEAVGGRGRVAMVTGTVATGKSELLHVIAEQAHELGALPLVATAARSESDLPFGVLEQLFYNAPLPEDTRERAMELLREATASGAGTGPGGPEQADPQIVHDLCAVLLSLSERRPLAIVVDDVQYADHASLLCLSYLVRRARFSPILAVFSQADHAGGTHRFFPTEMLRQPHCAAVRLAPLSRGAVLSMAVERSGAEVADLVPAWYALSGGNPLLLDGLMRDHESGAAEPAAGYGEAVLSCLHRADPELLEVARRLAVLGEVTLVDRLAGADDTPVSSCVHWLETAGILAAGRFRDDAGRAAVLAEVDAAHRRLLHRQAAELLYAEGASDVAVAEQLSEADFTAASWVVPVLESAARRLLGEGDVEPAVAYLELALRGCGDQRRRAVITTMLMRAGWRIDPNARTGHLSELTDALHNGSLVGGDVVVLARALLWHGRMSEARDVLDHLEESTGTEPYAAAELAGARMWLRCSAPPLLTHLERPARGQTSQSALPIQTSRRLESVNTLAQVLGDGDGQRDQVARTAERILRSACLDDVSMDTVESALLALVYGGRPEKAATWCDAFIDELRSRNARARQARLTAIKAEIHLHQGDLEEAAAQARLALEIIAPGSWGVAVGYPLATLLLAATAMGRYDEALAQVNRPVPEGMLETRFGLYYLHARGRYQLAVDDPAAALRDFRLCGELMVKWDMDAPGFIAWRTGVAEAQIRMGARDEARALIEEQLTRGGAGTERAAGVAMRLLAAASEVRQRPMLLRQASERLQVSGDRYELARSLFDLTEAYHSVGEFRRAGIIAGRARVLAQECGARPLSQALFDEGMAGEDYGSEENKVAAILSDAERRVAGLATVGYSNREIAAKLFITVSTVEQHLTRVYRKLNISQRSDLPSDLKSQSGHALIPAQ